MHIKLIYILSILFVTAGPALAQKNFVVYFTSGTVNIISNSGTAIAKRGNVITKANSLQLKQNSTCMLIAEKGRSLQLNTAGTYNFDALLKLIKASGSNVTSKVFSYVYDNLFAGHAKDDLAIKAGVFRGNALMKKPADSTIIMSDELTFTWRPTGKVPVHLIIKNNEKIIVDSFLKRSTVFQIDLTKDFSTGNVYEWKAEERDTHQPQEIYFKFLIAKKGDRKKILKDIKLLQDKKLTKELKSQMQQDIFSKWEQYYLK